MGTYNIWNMENPNSVSDVLRFCEFVKSNLERRFGDNPTIKDIIYHLTEQGIISPRTLRNYLIVKDFYVKLKENEGHMTNTFYDIAIEYDMSERQIQSIIYDYQKKFTKKSNIKNQP